MHTCVCVCVCLCVRGVCACAYACVCVHSRLAMLSYYSRVALKDRSTLFLCLIRPSRETMYTRLSPFALLSHNDCSKRQLSLNILPVTAIPQDNVYKPFAIRPSYHTTIALKDSCTSIFCNVIGGLNCNPDVAISLPVTATCSASTIRRW